MTTADTLEIVLDLRAQLGEGPIWDELSQRLIFVDSEAGAIYTLEPASKNLVEIKVSPQIGAAIPRRDGGFAVSSTDGLLSVQPTGEVVLLVPIERDRPHHRMNDAKCDSRGRMLSGTFSLKFERGAGALYRIDPDLTLTCLLPGVSVSNGIGWSPDERTLYFVDTSSRGIDAFDYDIETGAIANRRRFVQLAREEGFPDGLAVDAQGHVWLALYLGGAVRRYAPDGRLVAAVTLPVSGVTSCNFGGPDLTDLYITTARYGVPDDRLEKEPHAGALFRCRPGVAGLPSHRFAG
jgi:sugar lactone lactonase YvrE